MDPVIVLADTRLAVEPGEQVRTTATVRNAGTIVEQYQLHVLGIAAGWSDVLPHEISVLPGDETTVEVVFRPPRDAETPAGEVPFGFRCVSLEHPDRMAVAEGDVAVGALLESDAQLMPTQSHGRWSGRHRLILHNRGTVVEYFQLTATDPADALAFALLPDRVDVPPGGRGDALVRVRTRRPFLRGQPKPLPFQISYQRLGSRAGEPGTGVVPGTFEQRPILSKMVIVLLALALAGIAALFALNRKDDGIDQSIPPTPPRIETARAVGADKVQLVWARNPNATSYRVDKLLAESDGGGVEDSKEVPGERSAFTWEGVPANQESCFRVVAKNDAGESQPSEQQCVTTAGAGDATGTPPEGLQVTAQGQQALLKWQAADDKKASYVVFMDNTEAAKVPAGKASASIPVETPGKHCFSVQTQLGENVSEASKDECAEFGDQAGGQGPGGQTPGGQGPGGQGPGGQGPGGQQPGGQPTQTSAAPGSGDPVRGFWVFFHFFPADDPQGQSLAGEKTQQLQQLDNSIPARLRRVSESQSLQAGLPTGGDGWVVYLDGFNTVEDAIQFCRERRDELAALGEGDRCYAP
jgi:hypothetical protein